METKMRMAYFFKSRRSDEHRMAMLHEIQKRVNTEGDIAITVISDRGAGRDIDRPEVDILHEMIEKNSVEFIGVGKMTDLSACPSDWITLLEDCDRASIGIYVDSEGRLYSPREIIEDISKIECEVPELDQINEDCEDCAIKGNCEVYASMKKDGESDA